MTILRFPLDRARPSTAGAAVCAGGGEVVILPSVRVERVDWSQPMTMAEFEREIDRTVDAIRRTRMALPAQGIPAE